MKYFAYGSNMLTRRLRAEDRCPNAVLVGAASLIGYELRFHKRSTDGSGKCNAFKTGRAEDAVYGALFNINSASKSQLAKAEGLGKGYQENGVEVHTPAGAQTAITYLADPDAIDESVVPFDWYLDLVLAGAREHSLPPEYIRKLQRVKTVPDTDGERIQRALKFLY